MFWCWTWDFLVIGNTTLIFYWSTSSSGVNGAAGAAGAAFGSTFAFGSTAAALPGGAGDGAFEPFAEPAGEAGLVAAGDGALVPAGDAAFAEPGCEAFFF